MAAAWVLIIAIASTIGALLTVIYGVKAYAISTLVFIVLVFVLMLIVDFMIRMEDL